MIMKEIQGAYDSQCLSKEIDSVDSGSKVLYELNDSSQDIISSLPLKSKGGDVCWRPKVMDDTCGEKENGITVSPGKGNEGGPSHLPSIFNKDMNSLSSDMEPRTVEELTETSLFADINVLNCRTHELDVYYEEINDHLVKDICIDEGRVEEKTLIKDGKSDRIFLQPSSDDKHCKAEGGLDMEYSKGLEFALMENATDFSTRLSESKEENSYSLVDSKVDDATTQLHHHIPDKKSVSGKPTLHSANAGVLGSKTGNADSTLPEVDWITNQISENEKLHSVDYEQVQSPENRSRGSKRNIPNASIFNQPQSVNGEMSFSAASLIAYSGSLSHRSDGSATSTRSFAFPILQSEWNSSPVRMAKGDRRHLRKHKDWRSWFLCLRF